jgi:hypothetical protein
MTTNILICRIAWMTSYQGREKKKPHSGAAYVRKHGFGHEAYNFLDCNGRVYGYVEHPGNMNLGRLGAQRGALQQDAVTVVWTAPDPVAGGVYVVGWYQNATVHRELQSDPNDQRRIDMTDPQKSLCDWWVTANFKDALLLQTDERTLRVPPGKGFIGRSMVTYLDLNTAEQESFRQQLLNYINLSGKTTAHRPPPQPKPGYQPDAELRKKIEMIAVEAVVKHYESVGYTVEYVGDKKLGWDIEAKLDRRFLRVEVKGTSSKTPAAELSPNEYSMMKKYKDSFRLCIITDVLGQPLPWRFQWAPEFSCWRDDLGHVLSITDRTGAVVCGQ